MPLILKVEQNSIRSEEVIRQAAQFIRNGGIVAFPTETFYGLAALATDRQAVERLYLVKRRPVHKSFSLLIANSAELHTYIETFPPKAHRLTTRFWPGPLTLVFTASKHLPSNLTGSTGKIGVRISSHPVAQALVRAVGEPITATSANRSGSPSCCSPDEVAAQLDGEVEAVLDGGLTPGGKASTIADVTTCPPKILRVGAIEPQEIFACWEGRV